VILDNNYSIKAGIGSEAAGAYGNSDIGYIKRVASLHNIFPTLELAFKPHGVPSALA
jgi:hypothetical protein